MEIYCNSFFGALRYFNRAVDREVREQVLTWARGSLTEELGLNKDVALSKPIARRPDVTVVFQKIILPLELRQVRSMRVLLSVALFINLRIDGIPRIHEVTSTDRYPEPFLCWKDIKVWILRPKQNDKPTVAGLVKFGHMKVMKEDPRQWKEITLMFLPTTMWYEDSL